MIPKSLKFTVNKLPWIALPVKEKVGAGRTLVTIYSLPQAERAVVANKSDMVSNFFLCIKLLFDTIFLLWALLFRK